MDDSYYLHRFLSDFRDLISWIHDIKAIIAADELAKDVAGAEALLERHEEHRVRLDPFFFLNILDCNVMHFLFREKLTPVRIVSVPLPMLGRFCWKKNTGPHLRSMKN